MALVPGAAGAGFSNAVAAPPAVLPAGPQFDSGTLHAVSSTADGLAAGGAWDMKAWERGDGEQGRASACACVVLGAQLHAACWDDEAKEAVIVPFDVSETHASESSSSHTTSDQGKCSEHLEAAISFSSEASNKRINKWFRTESAAREHGELPTGVSVGYTAMSAAEVDNVALVQKPVRLLGLKRADQDPALAWESGHSGVRTHQALWGEDGTAVFSVPLPATSSSAEASAEQEVIVQAEDLVAFLLAACRLHCSRFRGWPLPTVALAVPAWWDLCRRIAAAEACARCGLHLRRIASRSACAATGAFHRLAMDSGKVTQSSTADANAMESMQSDGRETHEQVFVVDVDADSIGVSLLQVVVHAEEDKEDPKLGKMQPLTAEWFHAAAITDWETVAVAGGPRYWSDPSATKQGTEGKVVELQVSTAFDAGALAEGADSKKMLGLGVRCALSDCGAEVVKLADPAKRAVALIVFSGHASELDDVVTAVRETLGQVPVLHSQASDISCGLARLIATEAGEAKAQGLVSEMLSASLALMTLSGSEDAGDGASHSASKASSVAPLFVRATKLPACTTRRFSKGDAGQSGNMDIVVIQGGGGGAWQTCHQISHVLTALDDDMEEYVCEAATWAFQLDAGGLLTVSQQEVEGGRPPSSLRREARRRWTTRIVCIILMLLLALSACHRRYSADPKMKREL